MNTNNKVVALITLIIMTLSMSVNAQTWWDNGPLPVSNDYLITEAPTNSIDTLECVPVGTHAHITIRAKDKDVRHEDPLSYDEYQQLIGVNGEYEYLPPATAPVPSDNLCAVTFGKIIDHPLYEDKVVNLTIDDVGGYHETKGVSHTYKRCWYGPNDISGLVTICRNNDNKYGAYGKPDEYSKTAANRLYWYLSTDANRGGLMEITTNKTVVSEGTASEAPSQSMVSIPPGITPGHYWLWVRAEDRATGKVTPWEHAEYKEIDVVEMPVDRPDCGSSSSCEKGCQQCYSVDPKDGYLSEWPIIASTAGPHIPMIPISAGTTGNIYTKGKLEIVVQPDQHHLHAYGADGKMKCANLNSSFTAVVPGGGNITRSGDFYDWKHLDGTVERFAASSSSNSNVYDYVTSVVKPDGTTTSSTYDSNNNIHTYTYTDTAYGGTATWSHQYTVVAGNLTQYTKYRVFHVASPVVVKSCAYTYSGGRLQGITISQPNEVDKSISVSYDSQGMVNVVNQNGKVTKFTRSTNSVPTLTVTSEDANGNIYAAVDYAFGDYYTTIAARDVTDSYNVQTTTLNYVVDTTGKKRFVYNISEPSGLEAPLAVSRITSSSVYVADGFTWGLPSQQHLLVSGQEMWGQVNFETMEGRTKSYAYNMVLGKVTQVTYPQVQRGVAGTSSVTEENFIPIDSYQYDNTGRLTQKNSSDGSVETYTYDTNGRSTGTSYTKGDHIIASTMVYDSTSGALVSRSTTTTEDEIIKSIWQYNYVYYTSGHEQDLIASVELVDMVPEPNGRTMSIVEYAYTDGTGELQPGATTITSKYYAEGSSSPWRTCVNEYQYDTYGNMVASIDANDREVSYANTVDSNLKTERVIYSQQAYTETVSDCCKVLYQTDVDGKTVYYSYDPIGRIVKAYTNEAGQSENTPLMQYTYDGFGRVSSVTSRSNASTPRVTGYTYDKRNRVITIDNPGDLANELFYYDIFGNLKAKSLGSGRTAMYKYDSLNRVTDIYNRSSVPNPLNYPTTTPSVHKIYESASNNIMADVMSSVGQYRYVTNEQGQLTSTYWPLTGKSISYTYDTMGRKSSVSDGSNTTTYAYDPMGNLATISFGTDPATAIATYTTDAVGNRTHVAYGNDTSQDFSYGTDARYMLTGIDYAYKCNSATITGGIRITLTNGGNPLSWADNTDKFIKTFSYDNQGRLANADIPGVSRTDYGYDWVGNRTGPTAVYNAADQLTSYNGNTYSYNTYGDMTSGAGRTYTYNASSGVLNNITQNGGTYSNSFGPNGMRVSYDDQGEYINYAYDIMASVPAIISEEYLWESSPTSYYVREPNGALVMRLSGTDKKYYHFDELGSTLFLTDTNGVQTDKYVYNAWGKVVSSSGSTVNPFKFVGRLGYYQDAGTGLYWLGTRFYDPEAGVFTQRDAAKDGLSYYAYTSGNVMTAVDPWGEKSWDDGPSYRFGRLLGLSVLDAFASSAVVLRMNSVIAYIHNCISMLKSSGYEAAQQCLDTAFHSTDGMTAFDNAVSTAKAYVNGSRGFDSYPDFLAFFGPAGNGLQWHHIVEQSQIGTCDIKMQSVQNLRNMVRVSEKEHQRISGYYSSKPTGHNDIIRYELKKGNVSFENQLQYGWEVLEHLGLYPVWTLRY